MIQKNQLALTFALVAIAITVLCGPSAAHRALWTDEMFSLSLAEENPRKIIALTRVAQPGLYDHPPLYFLLLHAVLSLGNSPLLLRLPSLIFMAGAILLVSREIGRRSNPYVSLAVAVALVFHPFVRWQATNVRMYAMLLFLAALAVSCAIRVYSCSTRARQITWAAGLALTMIAAFYTSYVTTLVWAILLAAAIILALYSRKEPAMLRSSGIVAAGLVVSFLAFAPWLHTYTLLLHRAHTYYPTAAQFAARIRKLSYEAGGSSWPACAIVFVGCIAALCTKGRVRVFTALALAAVAASVAITAFSIPGERDLEIRYSPYVPFLLVIISVLGYHAAILRLPASFRAVTVSVLLLGWCSLCFLQEQRTRFRPVPDWWAAANLIEKRGSPGDGILTGALLSGESIVYHMQNPSRFRFVHYITHLDQFQRYCADPAVQWYVNVAPLPPEFQRVKDAAFPFRRTFEGNADFFTIEVASKRAFN